MWNKKNKLYGPNKNYSIIKKLRSENKSTVEFEVMLNNLTLEEIIALKLELSSKSINHKLYGFGLASAVPKIVQDALLKYAASATRSKKEAASFLGITKSAFNKLYKKYKIEEYFDFLEEKINKKDD